MNIIAIVGISAQKAKDGGEMSPLDGTTNSGRFVLLLEAALPDFSFLKTNLVPFAPLDENGKIRYPTEKECEESFDDLSREIQHMTRSAGSGQATVVLLGRLVTKFFEKKLGVKLPKYEPVQIGDKRYLAIDHPSYLMIYKRKQLDEYVAKIVTATRSAS